jgi:hypothetical protein
MTQRVFQRHTARITVDSVLSKQPTIQTTDFAVTRTFNRRPKLLFSNDIAF